MLLKRVTATTTEYDICSWAFSVFPPMNKHKV